MQTMTRDPGTGEFLDRLDERFAQVNQRFDRVEASIVDMRTDMRESNAELRSEIKKSSEALERKIEKSNAELREEIKSSNAELRSEIQNSNAELRTEILGTHGRIDKLQLTMLQIGGGMIGTMIVVFGGLAATQI